MKLNRLETKFFDEILNAELGVPVHATLEYKGDAFDLIVVPAIDANGYFKLNYYNAPPYDPEPQTNDDGITTKVWSDNAMLGTHPSLEKAWKNRDLGAVQLFPARLPFQHQERPELNARVLFADYGHRGSLVLDKNQVTVRDAPITNAEFCVVGFPDFLRPQSPRSIVLDTGDGWTIVVSKESEQTRDSVSHTGVIAKSDNSEYTRDELDSVLQGLKYFFAFVVGACVHPTVVIGYDSAAQPISGYYRKVCARALNYPKLV